MDYTFYYTIEPKFESVTKEKFEEFIKQYPRYLEENYCGIWSPPLITYNDLELADRWPHSVVACTSAYDSVPWDYSEDEREYWIMINYQEVFQSKTGNMVDKENSNERNYEILKIRL